MFHVYLVKIEGAPVGVVANSENGYRFYAIGQAFGELEALIFDSAEDAKSAAYTLAAYR